MDYAYINKHINTSEIKLLVQYSDIIHQLKNI